METKPVLYSFFRSAASWRVRIVLAYKGINYEYRAVNLADAQQKTQDFTKLNPMGQVPALVVGDFVLTQSLAIIDYLEDTIPGPSVIPKDPVKKAKARELAELIVSGTQPLQNGSVLKMYSDSEEKRTEWARFWVNRGLLAYEKNVQKTAGKYSVGDEVTLADVCLVPQMFNAHRFKVDTSQFPTCNRICSTLAELDAFKAADYRVQPDTPDELRPK